ncbi:MAG: hypothetical protein ABI183_24185 [Polyangiaceae bacterium]
MCAWRAAFVAFAIGAPLTVVTVMAGCDQGSPARPTSPPLQEAGDNLCPSLDPTFESIRVGLLETQTCGVTNGGCHSSAGGIYAGGLDYSLDGPALYVQLVGDGGGHVAQNVGVLGADAAAVYRVIPGDSDASALYVKLTIDVGNDPTYGSGMPKDHPGQLCRQDQLAVKTWIDNGAKLTEDGSTPDDAGDASTDADAADLDAGDAGD